MADNITVKDGNGSLVVVRATDDSSVFTPHTNISSLPGTVASDITAIKTAVELIDNAISGSEMQVDVVTLPGTVAAADGAAYGLGLLMQGDDGTDRRAILVDADGHVKVDVVTAPTTAVTGTVTANAGTNLNTSALALESGGNLAGIAAGFAAEGAALGSGVLLQADDGTDRINVLADTSGHLQIDVLTDPALSADTDSVSIGDGSNTATIRNLAANDALNVAIVDGSGDQVTSFGGGTQYAEDAAHTTGDTGTMMLAVRLDTGATMVSADGDYSPLQVDSSGALRVTGGGGGTEYTEGDTDASFTGNVVLAEGPSNTATPLSLDASGYLQVNVAAGSSSGTEFNEDAAHTTADAGVQMLAVRRDTAAVGSDTDGDYSTINVDASGRLWVHDPQVLTQITTLAGAVHLEDDAHTTADPGVQMLAVRNDTLASLAGTDGDYTPLQVDSAGSLWTRDFWGERVYSTDGGSLPTGAFAIAGDDGSNHRRVTVDSDGHLQIDVLSSSGQYAEDTAHSGGDVGSMVLAVRQDSLSSSVNADGDYAAFKVDASGRLWTHDDQVLAALAAVTGGSELQVDVVGALPAGTNNIGDVDVLTLPATFAAADGSAYGLGVLIQGDDGTDRRALLVDTSGHAQVDVLTMPTVTVTGTITANAGTNLNTSTLALESGGNLAAIAAAVAAEGAALGSGVLLQGDDGTDRQNVAVTTAGHVETEVQAVALPGTVYNGQNAVASAGTAEVLASSQALSSGVWIKALAGNTGIIYVGDSGVDSTNGLELAAGEAIFLEVDNLDAVYIDAATSSDAVAYVGT